MTHAAGRVAQARVVSSLTAPFGIKVSDWMQSVWLVESGAQTAVLAHTIPEVWQRVEKIVGSELDPLSPSYLARFEAANG